MDLNLDEETLMKLVPFWRTSLSDSKSGQYYFDHLEIHPIKVRCFSLYFPINCLNYTYNWSSRVTALSGN